ncbi:MAG: nucleotidyl transferase AbiEii/AbiGii toxin family protein [Anaerolineae bacterium]|nr:nucleotidyl transferase AbiEii/AbiGii toxin family protein [Gloeobacterales cyanobacterium ES-bin-313]
MIPQRNLSLLANRLHKQNAGRRIPEAVLERDYCLAWFLIGLSQSKLSELLIFKGGTALKRCHFADYRFSEDLDFTLARQADFAEIQAGLEEVYQYVAQSSAIRFHFDREDRQSHINCYTFYLGYQGPLPTPNTVKVDITISESVFFPVVQRLVLCSYKEFSDLPEDTSVRVYSLNEIATEKVMALADKARNEPRDLYDLWFLTIHAGIQLDLLIPAIEHKLLFRQKPITGLQERILAKETRLKALWLSRLANQMETLPQFEEVFRSLKRELRQASLP